MGVHVSGRLLARALFAGKKIESLLLNNNMLGGDGAGLLEQGLRFSSSLIYLSVVGNILGDTGMQVCSN